ncbi:MAG: N-acetylneuraminate synthase family protein [bacterium]
MTVDFVAEISSNHNRDLNRCLAFIDTAAQIGCSAIKFQLFKVDELFAPEILRRSTEHRRRQEWELPVEFLPLLAQRSHHHNLQFGCTPFYLQAVDELSPYVDFYKISSYEVLWQDLLLACARAGKPVVLSTGMATLEEVQRAVHLLRNGGCRDLTLLHCVSAYPTPPVACNLAAIQTLRDFFECPAGWSDHSVRPGVLYRAVHRWGATMIEFHLDLEGRGAEYDMGHCWLPGPIQHVIQTINAGLEADGEALKAPTAAELADRTWRADPIDGLRPVKTARQK